MFDKLILTLSLVNLLTNSAYSSIAPFYPLEAANKGINPLLIGKFCPLPDFGKLRERYKWLTIFRFYILCLLTY